MKATLVDPRDTSWEVDQPSYRVYFFEAGTSEEFEITDADVEAVLDWARLHAEGRDFVLYACLDLDGRGLVRLAGADPNQSGASP